MRLLLDECVTHKLRPLVVGHDIFTTGYLGWKGTSNGRLIVRATAAGYDGVISTDKHIPDQTNERTLRIPVIILDVVNNDILTLRPLVPALLALLATNPPPRFHVVPRP